MPERPVPPHDHTSFSRGGKLKVTAFVGVETGAPTTGSGSGTGVTDHGLLGGLADNDHTQYILKSAFTDTKNFIVDGGGSVITTGVKGDMEFGYACTIVAARLQSNESGSIVIDLWKDTYANLSPTVADTITASAKPTLSSAIKSQDTTLTGWTTAIAAGDWIRVNVDSVTTCTRVTLSLTIRPT